MLKNSHSGKPCNFILHSFSPLKERHFWPSLCKSNLYFWGKNIKFLKFWFDTRTLTKFDWSMVAMTLGRQVAIIHFSMWTEVWSGESQKTKVNKTNCTEGPYIMPLLCFSLPWASFCQISSFMTKYMPLRYIIAMKIYGLGYKAVYIHDTINNWPPVPVLYIDYRC